MTSLYVQGGTAHPLGAYPTNVMRPSPPAPNWQFHYIIPKREPMDLEEKNDSGINSASDFHSSSPGSDRENIPYPSPSINQAAHPIHHSDPLSPPYSEPMSPPNQNQDCTMPDHLKILQAVVQNNSLAPLTSPNLSESANEDELINEEFERELKTPKVNSHGKVRKFKCKQCDHVAITKWAYWDHCKVHIRVDKRLICKRCPFVTELKHHLEFHVLNHVGVKPFKCDKCEYTCVNKSMLTSHMKSHSNVYPYHCGDCTYATKYCHSLKTHLRKYKHQPGVVLNPDGTPNPMPVIDVYGKRRGPKVKTQQARRPLEQTKQEQEALSMALSQMMLHPAQLQLPFPGMPFFPPHPLLLQNLEKIASGQANLLPSPVDVQDVAGPSQPSTEALDLSTSTGRVQKNRRKGRAVRLNPSRNNSTDDELTTMFSNVEVVQETRETETPEEVEMKPVLSNSPNNSSNSSSNEFICQYCSISYRDAVLYTMHMGYHGYDNPFTCNMCGETCEDKVSFFLHMARNSHP